MPNLLHKIAFAQIKGNNPKMAAQILTRIGSEEEFFTLSENILSAKLELTGKITSTEYRQSLLEKACAEVDFIEGNNVKCLYYTDSDYPQRLLECDDAPVMLFCTGNANLNAKHVVSIVGTRNATIYGVDFINRLISDLKNKTDDLLIVSGLAFGCDITAHRRAMELNVPTAAVVAHGIDTIYPAEHRSYAAKMVRNGGMIISDYLHGTPPHRGNFLARNRIVAGISDCIVVAESAAKRGGALHTAKLGMLYNRDVFALPGRTSDIYSGGCNMLIRTNVAHLIENADDLMQTMNWKCKPEEGDQAIMFPEITPEQQQVIEYITQHGEAQINSLTVATGIPVGKLMAMLVEMEFNGLLLALPGARYRLA